MRMFFAVLYLFFMSNFCFALELERLIFECAYLHKAHKITNNLRVDVMKICDVVGDKCEKLVGQIFIDANLEIVFRSLDDDFLDIFEHVSKNIKKQNGVYGNFKFDGKFAFVKKESDFFIFALLDNVEKNGKFVAKVYEAFSGDEVKFERAMCEL